MIGRALPDMYFIWYQVSFHRHPRSNQLLLNLQQRLNTLHQMQFHVKHLADLCERQEDGTTIFCDNISSIALSKNLVFYRRSKHIEIRHYFIRELVENGDIKMEYCRSE